MSEASKAFRFSVVLAVMALCGFVQANAQQNGSSYWRVAKVSGDAWVIKPRVQQAALTDSGLVQPGDSIRTGRNGRVLLVRGEETILVGPNSVAGVKDSEGSSTTIMQQAGSLLFQVEKRPTRDFEVQTPYLVAAVKGTRFKVSLDGSAASVNVLGGSVEVSDFRTGQQALVLPGQSAKVQGNGGLRLSGTGPLNPIRQGKPRPSTLQRISVPRNGFSRPRGLPPGMEARLIRKGDARHSVAGLDNHPVRINAPLGEVKVDIGKASAGLSHEMGSSHSAHANSSTVWSDGDGRPGNGLGKTYDAGNNGSGNGNPMLSNSTGLGAGAANGNAGGNGNGNAFGIGNGNAFGIVRGKAKGLLKKL